MWILCALIGFSQLITLLMLSGILFSIAAVSRLMEIIIILIYPTAVFLLRQSANLIILLTILITKMTCSTFHNLCTLAKCNRQEAIPPQELLQVAPQLQLDMQTPFVPYKESASKGILENTSSKSQSPTEPSTDKEIVEPTQSQLNQ